MSIRRSQKLTDGFTVGLAFKCQPAVVVVEYVGIALAENLISVKAVLMKETTKCKAQDGSLDLADVVWAGTV